MYLPEVRRYSEEQGRIKPPVFESNDREFWLSYKDGEKTVGLINVHVETGSMCILHPYILRKYKDQYLNMINEFLAWFYENMPPEAVKLNAIIPDVYKNTILIAKKAGFKLEGIDRMSYRKNDSVYDRILLGITREEMSRE